MMRTRWIEFLFLIVGLVAVDCYIWVTVEAQISQSYDSWAFDQTRAGRQASVSEFIRYELGLSPAPAPAVQNAEDNPSEGLIKPNQTHTPLPVDTLIGRIKIPRLGINAMVREGAGEETLRTAIGHIPETALPGISGNVGIAGHRDTFFRPLRNIKHDDRITLETERGTYQYEVQSVQIVKPQDVSVLAPTKSPTLTLVTCYPFYYVGSAPKRFIVHAREVGPDTEASDGQPPIPRPRSTS